ncbi:acyl-CoA carboxylase subunit epsilon [Streptomyces sp. DSM 44915]|uniref:Acyl-CoA carboxylase subunit epsilon n=1 Tax=Streptomyces chisholmiae TaxID=3075540 RepID=A0ABU2JX07_9ACTN|nr:acyl-CoA carboxylase subunit epsilon [Streptomyces sp. DSM 44915]MDT0269392.1 acyl-CoA carboxylase subunit epsilon [Streptomyces sp. DSM 44915]
MTAVPSDPRLVRVEKGAASDEELAAVTALLMARAAQRGAPVETSAPGQSPAGWRRLERGSAYRAPHSWQG